MMQRPLTFPNGHHRRLARLGIRLSLLLGLTLIEARPFVGPQFVGPWGQSALAAPLSEIQRRGYLIVGVKDNLRPLGFEDEAGELQGFEIEIARRLAETLLGDTDAIQLRPVANRDRLPWLLANEVDLVIAQVSQTPGRSRLVSFSPPYYIDGTALITRQPEIRRLADLRQRRVAVLYQSSAIAVLRYQIPNLELVGVESYQEAYQKLEAGTVAAFAGDISVLSGWQQTHPAYSLLGDRLSSAPLSVMMPKGLQYEPLRQSVNGAIVRWQQEGWLEDRAREWGLSAP
ncbi:transporter substrate-binding domain-containing protein [Phormidium yuhuli AB48]|uniref:Transporter substrate-binding domain-containing protein n=1 Tax=Phormidium yuhuli AB48 TaxID=2940671 RepID=A0ABY5APU1_9CYAN|nr:transporter substrate-binding domain-containing protein [Phormidium yuhuli]USR90835.1 transporter substrate-binding domain-containing protein [Phormidium yuhuli AB48]